MAGVPRVQIVEKAWVNTDTDTDVHGAAPPKRCGQPQPSKLRGVALSS